jgi:phospholipid-binding lipoprotein MlaA
MYKKNKFITYLILFSLFFNFSNPILAIESEGFYNLSQMYLGEDKYEHFNRKMFELNSRLNKYLARPVHIIWSSIMPKYGIDRIQSAYLNIEYPKRLASCLIQKDYQSAKNETKRFLTNTTLGLGGLYDPAEKFFKTKQVNENMDQALAKCNVKSGCFMVMPIINTCTPRSLLGRALEATLDPSVYLATPIVSLIKFGLFVNKTSYMQPVAKMIESTYADPYNVAKTLYGIENYIKVSDLDRKDLLSTDAKLIGENNENLDELEQDIQDNLIEEQEENLLTPDINLIGFNSQSPVVDSMRTAFFDAPDINKSIWNELSIWNRSFANRIKTDSINVDPNRSDYDFRYILQKDKSAPVAIIYPSIGEGIGSHHSTVFAKIFYDEGYSVIIQGSHFQWEFVKSMPEGYYPGLPARDADNLKLVTGKILQKLEREHNCKFNEKILVGTSFGAMATLFVGDKESKNNTLGISKFIAISPPIELVYAMTQADKNCVEFNHSTEETKQKIAITATKIIQLTKLKQEQNLNFEELPFSEEEGKLIVSVLMRQKLSDLVFTLEGGSRKEVNDIYNWINNLSYKDYTEKYLLSNSDITLEDLSYDTSLYSISNYLTNSNNYKIYHSLDDFFVNKEQLKHIKSYSPSQVICLNNGSHLGFLYRKEFLDSFKKEIHS